MFVLGLPILKNDKYHSAPPPLAQGPKSIVFELCMMSVLKFRVQSRLTIIYRLAQNLFPALKYLLKVGKGLARPF